MAILRKIRDKPKPTGTVNNNGFPVVDDNGDVKGMMFTTFNHGKIFIDKEEGTFAVATPEMLDSGIGTRQRTSCNVSVCD
jgi:hypothetical protein